MPKLHAEALVFCLAWATLAVLGFIYAGAYVGALLSLGLLLIIMPTSSIVISKTADFMLERRVRWALLVMAALAFATWQFVQSSSSS